MRKRQRRAHVWEKPNRITVYALKRFRQKMSGWLLTIEMSRVILKNRGELQCRVSDGGVQHCDVIGGCPLARLLHEAAILHSHRHPRVHYPLCTPWTYRYRWSSPYLEGWQARLSCLRGSILRRLVWFRRNRSSLRGRKFSQHLIYL